MKKVNYAILMMATMILAVACDKISYRKTKSGLVYKIFPVNGKDSLIKYGQIVKFDVVTKLNDSLLYSSYGKIPAYIKLTPVEPPSYNLLEILSMMKKGDSAVTVQMADTLLKRQEQLPASAKKGDRITTTFHIIEVFLVDSVAMIDYNAQMEKYKPQQMKEQQEQIEKIERERKQEQAKEESELEKSGEMAKQLQTVQAYLASKKITAQKTGKGTFVHIQQQGSGPFADSGKYVNVKYTGRSMQTDSVFQSSVYAFQLGLGSVIIGWDEGLKLFKQGGKGTLYIPGFLAFGKNPPPNSSFKPYEPLKFDIELLEVSDSPINK